MEGQIVPRKVFDAFGLSPEEYVIEKIGSGHIHYTYKLSGKDRSFVLQRVNKNVFKNPEAIASNLRVAATYLQQNHPDFLFLTAIPTTDGAEMVYAEDGFPWRLFPFLPDTFTIDKVSDEDQAFEAAAAFASLTKNLGDVSIDSFHATIDRFHDLSWRWEQYQEALKGAAIERTQKAAPAINVANKFATLADQYKQLVQSGDLKLRITHNDTKINNVLFSKRTGKAVCAIDLDTLMPGYFIYDIGDMIRTFVSPVDEEEKDLSKIFIRSEIMSALIKGYLSQMNETLSDAEKRAIPFAGMMMTYIMALRMLTDFLNGDIYYQISYPEQNLVRAKNQFRLLKLLDRHFNTTPIS